MQRPLILASTSRYRRDLLARLRMAFEQQAPNVDETPLPGEPPQDMALRLSRAKAEAVAARNPEALVIGCDQVAEAAGTVLGKPGHRAAAIAQLSHMSGRRVTFWSGLALAADGRTTHAEVVPTRVIFRELDAAEIEHYVDQEPALDCAGSAKIEGLGISLMASVESNDPTALIGLPLIALCRLLRSQGIPVP
jgi:septum formation protein